MSSGICINREQRQILGSVGPAKLAWRGLPQIWLAIDRVRNRMGDVTAAGTSRERSVVPSMSPTPFPEVILDNQFCRWGGMAIAAVSFRAGQFTTRKARLTCA